MEKNIDIAENDAKQYIVVKIGSEQYGIDISYIDNIVRMQKITRVPKIQSYFKGVINLRGEIVSVMSIRNKMGLEDDVFTNHIHADDLARACMAAVWKGRPQRAYNVSDSTHMKMGDYFDLAADLYGLPRPPRVPRSTAQEQLSLMLLSFMSESRRLDNQRMLRELGLRLRYPSVAEGLRA